MKVFEVFCECGGYIQSKHRGELTCQDCGKKVNVAAYLKSKAQEHMAKLRDAQARLRMVSNWIRGSLRSADIAIDKNFQLVVTVGDSESDGFSVESYHEGLKLVALAENRETAELTLHQAVKDLSL